MSIDTQLYLLTAGIAIGMSIVAWQAFQLRKIYRSHSSLIGALSFLALGLKQVYGLIRLHSLIAEARAKGVMIEHLSIEQWLVGVFWNYLIIMSFIFWLHLQHRDLKQLGIY